MKKLMAFALTGGELYVNSCPDWVCFSADVDLMSEPLDWREDLRRYAVKNGWKLEDSNLESVEAMLDFMIANSPFFSNCICRSDVHLPGGAVLLDSTAPGAQEPLMIFWEEEA